MIEWKDITSYSRGEERVPSWWSAKVGCFTLKVGNSHIHYREDPKWFMIFDNGSHEILGAKDKFTEGQAKNKALEVVERRLKDALEQIELNRV